MDNKYQNIDFQFSESEMQERLPDYIFGNLQHEEKVIFEKSLAAFPEIQKEIEEVKGVFAKLDKIEYDKVIFDKTIDLPTRVARKLQPQNSTKSKYSSWRPLRLIVPVMVFAVVYFIGVQNNFWVDRFLNNSSPKSIKVSKALQKINSIDLSELTDSTIEELADEPNIYTLENVDLENTPELVASVEDLYNDYFFDESIDFSSTELLNTDMHALNIDNFNNLQEEEFLEIIEEIQNVNF